MITPFSIIFFKGKGTVGKLIKWITKGRYSHVGIFMTDCIHVAEINWYYPFKIRHTKYATGTYDLYELNFELTEDDKQKLMDFIHRELNQTYDWKFLWRRLFYILFGIKPKQSDSKFTCDEVIYEMFRDCLGVELIDSRDNLTPENLAKSKWLRKVK